MISGSHASTCSGETAATPPGDLLVYWFPTGPEDAQHSSLRTSRNLVNWSAHCVGVALVPDSNADLRQKFLIEGSQSAVVVATRQGAEIGRVAAPGGAWRRPNQRSTCA